MSADAFATTQRSLHILAEHVLAAARYAVTGRIGLVVVPGGIVTPPFGDDGRSVGIVGGELVVRDRDGERRAAITTLRAAARFVGVVPGAPANVYTPATPCTLDEPLAIDLEAYHRVLGWYSLVDAALRRFRDEIADDEPSDITLWPEHFDVAIRAADVNYGGLAGDATVGAPYVYVGPPVDALPAEPSGPWNQPFGASRTWDEAASVDDAVAFFRAGRTAARSLVAARN